MSSISIPRRTEEDEVVERTRGSSDLRERLRVGVVAGAVATTVMTAFRLPISRSLPPTAEFWARYVSGGSPDDHPLAAIALHVVYGVGAGVPFALAVPWVDALPERTAEVWGVVTGVAYGLVLSVFGLHVVLGKLLDLDLAPDERFVFHLGHVVYGLTLGTWIGSRASN